MPEPIRATLLIDPAQLPGATSPDLATIMADVRALLADVRERLDAESRLAVDEATAARMVGCCGRTLRTCGAPYVTLGTRRLYRIDGLKEFLAAREQRRTA